MPTHNIMRNLTYLFYAVLEWLNLCYFDSHFCSTNV